MTAQGAKLIARAVRHHVERHTDALPTLHKAVVKQADPLIAELLGAEIQLDDDQLLLGSAARRFDDLYGIETGDTLYLFPLADGDWLVLDVGTDRKLAVGLAVISTVRAITTDHGNVVRVAEYVDADGNSLGVSLIYDSASLHPSPD